MAAPVNELPQSATSVMRFANAFGAGQWEQDEEDHGWIYRVKQVERVSLQHTLLALLFVEQDKNSAFLSRWVVDGEDLDVLSRILQTKQYLALLNPPPSSRSSSSSAHRGRAGDQSSNGDIEGAQELGPDWSNKLEAYIRSHAHYPEQAVQNGEQGDSAVQVTVDSDGHVKSAALDQRSGSVWLDTELLSIFRHARLPPFPAGANQPEITFRFTMHYILHS